MSPPGVNVRAPTAARLRATLEPLRALLPSPFAVAPVFAFVAAICGVTVAHTTGALSIGRLAASPQRIGEGKLWVLLSSGFVVDKPVGLSLASFAGLAVLVLLVSGPRVLWLSAALGHVCSTLLVYSGIALVRLVHPNALHGVLALPDYGVSAITAAWLGAIAAVSWRRSGKSIAGRAATVTFCLASAIFAWIVVRRALTVIDSEHLFAFAIGIAVAGGRVRLPLRMATFARRRAAVTFER